MDEHSKNIQKYLAWFDELEEENVVKNEEDWIVSDTESEVDHSTKTMDHNDLLQTQSNVAGGYEDNSLYPTNHSFSTDAAYQNTVYAADPSYNSSSTGFDYSQQTVIPSYGNMSAPIQTAGCNSMNDSFSYVPNVTNYGVESNNYYNPSLPSQSYQNQSQDGMILDQGQNFASLNAAPVSGAESDHYLQMADHHVPSFNAITNLSGEHASYETQSNVMNVLGNDSTAMCVDMQSTNDYVPQSIPNISQNFPEELNSVTCYTESPHETVIETSVENTVHVTTSDTWNMNTVEMTTTGGPSIVKNEYETPMQPLYQNLNANEVQHREQEICKTEEQNGCEISNETNQIDVRSNEVEEQTSSVANETKMKQNIQICIRNGCVNPAIHNPEWEQEFCSNDCVILHCKNVFKEWVQGNQVAISGQ